MDNPEWDASTFLEEGTSLTNEGGGFEGSWWRSEFTYLHQEALTDN